jgi:hypothetical protein
MKHKKGGCDTHTEAYAGFGFRFLFLFILRDGLHRLQVSNALVHLVLQAF